MLQTLKRRILNFIEPLLSFCIGLPLFVIICIPYLVYRNIRLKPYNIEQGPYVWKNRDKLIQLIDQDKSLSRKERRYLMSIPYVLCLPLGQGSLFWDNAYIKLAKCVKKYDWETRENCTEAVYAELKRDWLTPEEIKRYEEHKKMITGYTRVRYKKKGEIKGNLITIL